MAKEGKSGVSANTPKNILFGAGTIHRGLKYEGAAWNFADSLVGATSGGSKVSIKPEITKVEVVCEHEGAFHQDRRHGDDGS